jgi:hypothetical protein
MGAGSRPQVRQAVKLVRGLKISQVLDCVAAQGRACLAALGQLRHRSVIRTL